MKIYKNEYRAGIIAMLKKFLAIPGVIALVAFYCLIMGDSHDPTQSIVQQSPALIAAKSTPPVSFAAPSLVASPSSAANSNTSINSSVNHEVANNASVTEMPDVNSAAMKKSDEFSRYSQSLSEKGISLQDDLLTKFKKEPVDAEWAPLYEEKIRDFFADTQELNYFVPDSVICKTSRCQIQLHAANEQELSQASRLFATALHAGHSNIEKSEVVVTPDFTQKIVFVYIGKNDQSNIYQ